MKLRLSLLGMNETIKNLKDVGIVIEKDFSIELVDNAYAIRDKAKEILEGKTNPMYSTGKLRDSIRADILDKDRVSIGPDMREVPYAEWVEFGHWMTGPWVAKSGKKIIAKGNKGARWWEGHHYMEGAWLEISPTIIPKIAKSLEQKLNSFARTKTNQLRNIRTGGYSKGKSLIKL